MKSATSELNSFVGGLALAAIAGLLMGAVCRPDLGGDDRPQGPQILAGWTPGRSTGPFDDGGGAVIADWKGSPPAYVVGTDALKAANWLGPAASAPLPDRDLEPLPTAKELRRIEEADADVKPDDLPATDTAALEPDKAAPTPDMPVPG